MTSQRKDKQKNLLNQQLALHAYLDDLLQEVPDEKEAQPELVQTSKLQSLTDFQSPSQQDFPQVMDMPVLRELQEVESPEPPVETAVEAKIETQEEAGVEIKTDAVASIVVPASIGKNTAIETNKPEWAQKRFQCLLFKVAGVSLAVPLIKLNGVIPWSDKISPLPGHPKAFLGVIRYLDQNIQVIDTAQIILPEKQQETFLTPPDERLHNVILVDNGRWGLACDEIGETITLEPEEVRWRTSQGKLKWLAGTVLQHLCALLEVDILARLLQEGFSPENSEEKG